MDATNKQRLRVLHAQLGTLLNQRKALNSKVTLRHFDQLREVVEADSDPYEIKTRLTRLEQSLKHEGLFKNVKSDFVLLKKEIIGSLSASEHSNHPKQTLPGIGHPRDRTFYVPPKHAADNDHAAASGATTTHKHSNALSTDDMRVLNTAIGKLYRHLQLNSKDQENAQVAEFGGKDVSSHKENVNIMALSSYIHPEETFHDIVLKLRNFEKEFQRQKVQQQKELNRLRDEIKRLNKNSNELKRENERIKGVQPILTKAKGKQVERIEERYRTEKKGMEEKLIELESGMKKNFAQLLNDKEEIRSHVRSDVDSLMSSINSLHHMVHGHHHESSGIRHTDDDDVLPTKDLLDILSSVSSGVHVMKTKTQDLSRKAEDVSSWRRGFKDLEREINKFCQGFNHDLDDEIVDKNRSVLDETDPQKITIACRTKLQKTKENLMTKLKSQLDSTSVIKRKERGLIKYRKHLQDVQAEISKLHDHVISVQIQDISIDMPEFKHRHDSGDRSDGSTDDLPESDRMEHVEMIEKLRQIGTMVTHFQQLIIDRTGILSKMENDILPLKIRVNRLHEEISKAMNNGASPDHDIDDSLKTKRSFTPDSHQSSYSREINVMLTKLSTMELSIRHLLETYASNHGRASI